MFLEHTGARLTIMTFATAITVLNVTLNFPLSVGKDVAYGT